MTHIEKKLWQAYESTDYWVYTPTVSFCIKTGQRCYELEKLLRLHQESSWVFISAFNPQSQKISIEENIERHHQLINHCEKADYIFFEGEGVDREKKWEPEKSLLVLGIDKPRAIKTGQKFQQKAVVYGIPRQKAHLVAC